MYPGNFVGLLLLLGSVIYFIVSIRQVTVARDSDIVGRVIQLIFGPIILFLSGIILFFQGWRQDPILLVKDILMIILMGYLVFRDLKRSNRTI